MNNHPETAIDIEPTDILFDCPQCGKSLVIDERGAGYLITCPDCQNEIQVPGIDASHDDPDSARGGQRVAMDAATTTLNEQIASLRNQRTLDAQRFRAISEELGLIQAALDRIVDHISEAESSPP
ncbi:MAG TPA: hypothetical protein PKE55_04780 [Kiritimatiellia bacterium]|nr:hypothetical protein [Kiritimatiellia bacterium]